MKPAFTFFLLVVFLLTGGNKLANDGISFSNSNISGTHEIKKIPGAATRNNKQDFLQLNKAGSGEQNDNPFFVADKDDENEDNTRRYITQTVVLIPFLYAYILNYSGNPANYRNSFYKLPYFTGACKYIEQRSLRI